MRLLTWGRPTLEIIMYGSDGSLPEDPLWTALPNPKENTTNLDSIKGQIIEIRSQSGSLIEKKATKSTFTMSFELFIKKGFVRPIIDVDGVVYSYYGLRLTPEDPTNEGILMERCFVSADLKYNSADGSSYIYSFEAMEPRDGSNIIKPWYAPINENGLHFTEIPIYTNGKAMRRIVESYATMQALRVKELYGVIYEYTIKSDETNGGVIGHYTSFNGNLTFFVEGDAI